MKMPNAVAKVAKNSILQTIGTFALKNKSALLTAGSIVGSAGAIAVMGRNSEKIHEIIADYKSMVFDSKEEQHRYIQETLKKLVPLVLPIALLEGMSITCSIAEHKNNKKMEKTIASLSAAYMVTKSALDEYAEFKKEACKELGAEKTAEIDAKSKEGKVDEIIQSSRVNNPNFHAKPGEKIYIDPFTHNLFSASPSLFKAWQETLRGYLNDNDGYDGRSPKSFSVTDWFKVTGQEVPDTIDIEGVGSLWDSIVFANPDPGRLSDFTIYYNCESRIIGDDAYCLIGFSQSPTVEGLFRPY